MTSRVVTFATSQPEPKRSTHAARLRRLSIVIPALNEERRLPETLAIIERWCQLNLERAEIIVVDDGSADRTADVARELGARCQPSVTVRVLRNALNRGKGASVRAGVLSAAEPYILMTDADLSTPIEEMEKLAAAIEDADVAIGSRAARGADIQEHQPFHREMMGKTFNKLVRLLVTGGIRDTQCGFKLFRREVAQQIFSRTRVDRFAFDVEAIYVARRLGYRIEEVPVVWRNSPASTVDPLRDAARMFLDLFRIRRLHRRK